MKSPSPEPGPDAEAAPGPIIVFASFADADIEARQMRHAMSPLERTQITELLRRVKYPEEYRHPPTVLEPFVLVPYEPR